MAKRPTERPCRMCGRVQTRAINGHCTACHYYSITATRPIDDSFALTNGTWIQRAGGVRQWRPVIHRETNFVSRPVDGQSVLRQ